MKPRLDAKFLLISIHSSRCHLRTLASCAREHDTTQHRPIVKRSMLVARFFDVADQSRHLAMLLMLTTAAFRCRPTLAQSFQQRVFRAIVSSSGGSLCAADPPDVTVASTRSAVSCAKMCSGATATTTNKVLQATGCRYFNYKRRVMSGVGADGGTYAGSCELYLSVPKCFGSDAGCTLYQVRNRRP